MPPSKIVPYAVKVTVVSPLPELVRRNGEPATAMQVCPDTVLAQLVPLVVAGAANPSKTKSRVVPVNVMKSFTMPPGVRFMILPITPAPSVPPEYVKAVPAPVSIQPAVPPRVAGSQVMVVKVTVTPPPAQFASLSVPIAEAEAVGIRAKNKAAPTAMEPHDKV